MTYEPTSSFTSSASQLPTGDDLAIGSTEDAPPVRIQSIVHGGDCDVYIDRIDTNGVVQESVLVDSFVGEGISQGNEIEVNRSERMRLRIENTSSGSADYIVTGVILG